MVHDDHEAVWGPLLYHNAKEKKDIKSDRSSQGHCAKVPFPTGDIRLDASTFMLYCHMMYHCTSTNIVKVLKVHHILLGRI